MSDSLRNKLLAFEMAPPSVAWEYISKRLEEEFNSSDAMMCSKMESASIVPARSAWTEIESILDSEQQLFSKVRRIQPVYRRLAAAVAMAAVVGLSAMYLLTGGQRNIPVETTVTGTRRADISIQPSGALQVPSPAASIATVPIPGRKIIASGRRAYAKQENIASLTRPGMSSEINEAIFTDLQTVKSDQPVSVPAKPLKDAYGNLIMDLTLIRRPGDAYITVTGPNGSQTKISSKFLQCLRYMNGDLSSDDTDNDGVIWKDKFRAWREKLLNENGFIPTAGNFFDIFEMNDILQE